MKKILNKDYELKIETMIKHILFLIAVVVGLIVTSTVGATDPMQMTMTLQSNGKESIKMTGTGTMTIDWGDGTTIETHTLEAFDNDGWYHDLNSKYSYHHAYSGSSTRTITIFGENITHLNCGRMGLTSLDVSNNIALTHLYCGENRLSVLDVSKNPLLTDLWCHDNQLTSLDLSNNTVLIILYCSVNQLTYLYVGTNTELARLDCSFNQLSTSALDALFATLHGNSIKREKRICISHNQGTNSCSQGIATDKGWTVKCPVWSEGDVSFVSVENRPLFKGGDPEVKFREYIIRKTVYPRVAEMNGIQGVVLVKFDINKEGKVVNARVARGVHPLLDAEALRVVKSSPKWTPAVHKGEKVIVQYNFPFVFILNR